MSRTYRTQLEWKMRAHGRDWTWEEKEEFLKENYPDCRTWWFQLGWNGHYLIDRKCRDRKPWNKPPKWYKKINRRCEKHKVNQMVRMGVEYLPIFPKSDAWDWS